ncbi:TRAM protein [Hibiscus syriacus]|uniref:TRAM protein n=1 Tax=Hibiscus syriacus TaxID=106335 RepID=A0A6A2Y8T6_HIBSY|nr:TRAM protein [Hibiscus syriacus]
MENKSYQNPAELLVKEYLLADSFIPYTSIICGICACKMVYDLTQLFSSVYFKSYPSLSKVQRTEWSNRSALSTFSLGVSVGYFLADLGMIIWFYPSLDGMEYVLHHLLSLTAVAYSMLTGEGQLYTFMVLISETTTPGINLRWYLDTVGMKRTRAYLINGVVIFVAWLVARIFLFIYLFYHIYLHYDQVNISCKTLSVVVQRAGVAFSKRNYRQNVHVVSLL